MHSSFLLLLFANILSQPALSDNCCGFDGVSACCGGDNNSCDIMCCNCDSACTSTCGGNCLALCELNCPPIPSKPEDWLYYDQQCYVHCNKECDLEEETPVQVRRSEVSRREDVFGGIGGYMNYESVDEEVFRQIDKEGLGYFTYEQFLGMRGWRDVAGVRKHFDRHDVDGNGVITAEEMRRRT
ncbi:hypothetical protein EJ04DRAFT_581410 [Polyplosphaeria fusca]|uniref:EF-hand domain-containing protein n=1 Tax=Polyplosphaeria fusca TaxID=682080 RepID=A0A9P4QMI3_9PLEO|nr:hypothetical protein EJ04DRAFT_581410 [Polyplosphaeria fusca]